MAPRKAFEESREWIEQQMDLGIKIKEIYKALKDTGVPGSLSTFEKRLQEWQCRKRKPSIFEIEGIDVIIRDLFYRCLCSDKEILQILQYEYPEYGTSYRSLRRHRRMLDLRRRTRQTDREAQIQNITAHLEEELKQGHLEDHGRHLLHVYMKRKYGHEITIGE